MFETWSPIPPALTYFCKTAFLPWGLWASRPLQPAVVCTSLFFFPWECWLVTCGVGSDLSQTRAAPEGLSRNTHEGALIKKSGNEDKCFRGRGENASPWHSLQLLWVLEKEVVVAKGNNFFFVVYFSWHWKHFSFPPGCSNSHLLTAFHAGLQLTPGRYLTMLPLKWLCPQRSFNALTYNHS